MKFDTRRIYLKDASFESPCSPGIFTERGVKPGYDVQVSIDCRAIEENENDGLAEIILKITVTSKHEEKIIYLAEVHQAGVFQIQHPDADTYQMVMEVACPHILLPFAREELNSLISKGGFSNFLLSPINFEALYRAKKEKDTKDAASAPPPESMN